MTDRYKIIRGDMRCELALMPENSIDAIVCDPPYEIAFMGRSWDRSGIAFDPDTWAACLRVLKPGGYLVAFGATRTSHRITCAIEDAGFEIRDTLQWVFGSGFPKSLDVGKAIDKEAGAVREVVGQFSDNNRKSPKHQTTHAEWSGNEIVTITAPATDLARQWHGYGTALKPAHEPITLARKPLSGTVARNVAEWGTGGIDVDGCRVGGASTRRVNAAEMGYHGGNISASYVTGSYAGRWPPNIILGDGAGEVIDGMSGVRSYSPDTFAGEKPRDYSASSTSYGRATLDNSEQRHKSRNGGASEFFPTFCYVPKASRKEREAGLAEAGIEPMTRADVTERGEIRNTHPTVKPVEIMRWLVRLVSPPRSYDPVILDPFAGSGSTGIACVREGVRFVGVELDERHAAIARARIDQSIRNAQQHDAEPEQMEFAMDARET